MPEPIQGVSYTVKRTRVENSTMTADVVCYGCSKWSGGTLDTSSTRAAWIWAAGPGKPVASDANDAHVDEHSEYGKLPVRAFTLFGFT